MHSNSSYEVVHSEERGEWFERDHVNGMTRIPSELREYIYIYISYLLYNKTHTPRLRARSIYIYLSCDLQAADSVIEYSE